MHMLRFDVSQEKGKEARKEKGKEKVNMEFLKGVVERIRPSPRELFSVRKMAGELKSCVRRATKREVVLVGSVAKGTFLSGEADIDLFILFKERLGKEGMKTELEKIFRRAFPKCKYQMNYAEHPYIRFHFRGTRVDLVPAYKMASAEERLTAVDRSVLHMKFILKNLSARQKDEVRLLKKFLKASGLYGAEIRVEGFSGYLCELLAIRYGSFRGTLKAAARFKLPIIIDIKKYYKKEDCPELLKRFGKSFVVIDPTDKNRNVAAALSGENLEKFVALARRFLKKPSERYFFMEENFDAKISRLKKKNAAVLIRLEKEEVVDDVLWGQLKKFMRMLEHALADFAVKDVIADSDEDVRIAIIAKKAAAGGVVERQGPPLEMKKHVDGFRRAHRGQRIIKRRGRLVVFTKVPKKTLQNAVSQFIRENHEKFSHLPLKGAAISSLQ